MRRLLSILALTLALPLAGCGSTEPEEEGIEGVYTLQTINGGVLPWLAIQDGDDRLDVLSGAITLNMDGSFHDITTVQYTVGGVVTTEDDVYTGTFVKTIAGVTLTAVGFEPYTLTIAGKKMTQQINEFELIYQR